MILITQPRVGLLHNEIMALELTAKEMGWEVLSAPSGWRLPEEVIGSKAKGVPYGSQTFGEVISQQMGWKLRQNSFDWLAKVPFKYLKRRVDFMTLGEAKKLTERKFIKPADDKCFDAAVYNSGEFKPHEIIANDYPVLVSEVVQWDLEYRCFVKDGQVLTWSNYLYYGQINSLDHAQEVPIELGSLVDFVNNMLEDMPETVPSVVDVGVIPNKGFAIIETNQAWASGLYHCDLGKVLKVLEDSCEVSCG